MEITAPGDTKAVVAALKNAAAETGSDFSYLLGTAMRESSLKTNAQSATSSAGGLFQFVDQTWLGLIKNYGAKYGLGSMAQAINVTADGRYHADNDAAHFLGADGACKLIRGTVATPNASAAQLFPDAASANRDVFFRADGSAKNLREVYDWAMREPGGQAPVANSSAAPATSTVKATTVASNAVDSNLETLLAGVINWQPGSFFSDGKTGASPLSMGSGLLDLLSGAREGES